MCLHSFQGRRKSASATPAPLRSRADERLPPTAASPGKPAAAAAHHGSRGTRRPPAGRNTALPAWIRPLSHPPALLRTKERTHLSGRRLGAELRGAPAPSLRKQETETETTTTAAGTESANPPRRPCPAPASPPHQPPPRACACPPGGWPQQRCRAGAAPLLAGGGGEGGGAGGAGGRGPGLPEPLPGRRRRRQQEGGVTSRAAEEKWRPAAQAAQKRLGAVAAASAAAERAAPVCPGKSSACKPGPSVGGNNPNPAPGGRENQVQVVKEGQEAPAAGAVPGASF